VRYKVYQTEYSNKGWILYRRDNKLPNYKLRIDVIQATDGYSWKDYKAHVKLATRAGKELTVGIFTDYETAREWASKSYPQDSNISNIVYASNELSKKYLNQWKS
jgi:tRNA splicing endonuclease